MSDDEARGIITARERARRRSRLPLKLLLPTVAALGAGAAVAVGQIPGSGGTLTACYQDVPSGIDGATSAYGTLRLIDPSAQGSGVDPSEYSCAATEQTVTWNQQGPMGPTGPQGAPAQIVGESTFNTKAGAGHGVDLRLGKLAPINVESFSWGAAAGVTGSGTGKVSISSFEITKNVDAVSPLLMEDFVEHKSIGFAAVDLGPARDDTGQVASFQFQKVFITSISQGTGGTPTESVSFSYGQVRTSFSHHELTTNWSTGKSLTSGGFDIVTNGTNDTH